MLSCKGYSTEGVGLVQTYIYASFMMTITCVHTEGGPVQCASFIMTIAFKELCDDTEVGLVQTYTFVTLLMAIT